MSEAEKADQIWIKNCYREPGEHILVGGQTGSGKTQGLYFIASRMIRYHGSETLIWFDTGKASEIMVLATLRPLKIFHPKGTAIEITPHDPDHKLKEWSFYPFQDVREILRNLESDKINVVSIEPFFPDPTEYTKTLTAFFSNFITMASNYEMPIPLAVFIDELQSIAPGQGQALNAAHQQASMQLQRNIERLRALETRIVGAVQDWTKVRRGVRQAFSWIVVKRGMMFTHRDIPQLAQYNKKFWNLEKSQAIFIYPDKHFAPVYARMPFYGRGKDLGKIRYHQRKENVK